MGPLNESAINSAIDAQFPTRARGVKELCQAIPVIETWGQNTYPDFRLDEIRYAEAGIHKGKSRLVIFPIEVDGANKIVVGWQDLNEGAQPGRIVAVRSLDNIGTFFLSPARSTQFNGENPPSMLKSGKYIDDGDPSCYRLRTSKIGISRQDGTNGIEIGDIVIKQEDYGVLVYAVDSLVAGVKRGSSGMMILNSQEATPPGGLRLEEKWGPAVSQDIISRLNEQDKAESTKNTLDLKQYRQQI